MNLPPATNYAGQLGFVLQPPLIHWHARDGGSQEEVYKGPSAQLAGFIGQMNASKATSVRTLSNNGRFATVAVNWAAWQDGVDNTASTLPDGQWSISPGGVTQHIFRDARFSALAADEQTALNKFRTDPTADVAAIASADGLEFLRLLQEQKDTQEADSVIVTRRVRVQPGFTGTVGWENVGKVFEDNATFQTEADVPDAIMDEFDRDYQWLVRPFTKEQQGDGSYVYQLTFWGARAIDDFQYPDRV